MSNGDAQQNIRVFVAKFPFDVLSDYLPPARERELNACLNVNVRQSKYYVFKLLELALTHVYGKSLRQVELNKNAFGKWTCDACELSLSHCADIAVVALSDKPVGVDVELIDVARFDERLQRRIFTDGEMLLAEQMSSKRRADYANRLWTVKEALFKLDGNKAFNPRLTDAYACRFNTVRVADGDKRYYLTTASNSVLSVDYIARGVTVKDVDG